MTDNWNNVILLSADALRADHLSCYGYDRKTSPELDRLASESLRFTNAYSASSHTREAVPALLTGKFPDKAINKSYRLASETVASVLSREGFATAGFHSNPYVSRAYGFDEGFDKFDDDLHFGKHKFIALAQRAFDKLRNRHYARAWEINERSLEWIDSLDDGQPFFLWNHYMDTHGPYEPPEEYREIFHDKRVSDKDAQALYKRAIQKPNSITDGEREQLIDLYDAEIRLNDEYIGRFLKSLSERGLLENTLIVITADHGDAFGEHGYFEHPRYLHQELTHVPLFVRVPDGTSETVDAPVSTLDVAVTISENAEYNAHSYHRSLLSKHSSSRTVFSQARGEGEYKHIRRFAVQSEHGECFAEWDGKDQTISVKSCSDDDLAGSLRNYVRERVEQIDSTDEDDGEKVDEEIERRLSALGYKE
ncbi:sulfatase [Haladaptatus sp. NG-SE-30]